MGNVDGAADWFGQVVDDDDGVLSSGLGGRRRVVEGRRISTQSRKRATATEMACVRVMRDCRESFEDSLWYVSGEVKGTGDLLSRPGGRWELGNANAAERRGQWSSCGLGGADAPG